MALACWTARRVGDRGGRSRRSALFAHHDQPALDIADQNIAAWQVRIDAPCTIEGRVVVRWIRVEIAKFGRRIRIGNIQDADATRIVGEVELVPDGIAIVVNGSKSTRCKYC